MLGFLFNLKDDSARVLLARGAILNLVVKATGAALALLSEIVVARLLGVATYGYYIYAVTWASIMVMLCKFGFDAAAIRFVATYREQGHWNLLHGYISFSLKRVLSISIVVAVLGAVVIGFLKNYMNDKLFPAMLLAPLIWPLLSTIQLNQGILYGLKRVAIAELASSVVRPAGILMLAFCALLIGMAPVSAVAAVALNIVVTSAALALSIAVLRASLSTREPALSTDRERALWQRTAGTMMIISGLNVLLIYTDIVMLGVFAQGAAVGLYGAAAKLAGVLIFFLLAVNSILAPMVAGAHARGQRSELQRIVSFGVGIVFTATLVVTVPLLVFESDILALFGDAFVKAGPVLNILIIGQLINVAAGPVALLLNMTGHHQASAQALAFGALMNIVLNAVLIPKYGPIGAAVATVLSTTFWNATMSILVWKRLRIVAAFWGGLWRQAVT
jgi:O-antigen/teichoic acid export membrane protein